MNFYIWALPYIVDEGKKERFINTDTQSIHVLGKQNMVLRGHRESIDPEDPETNPGNFIVPLKLQSEKDEILHDEKCHLHSSGLSKRDD